MLVDMHAHVIPDELAPFPKSAQAPRPPHVEHAADDPTGRVLVSERSRFPAPQIWYSAEKRLEAMQRDGVDVEVVSPMPSFLDFTFTPADGLELARRVNEFVVRLCESDTNRFFGFGMVPLQDLELAGKELSSLVDVGLRGLEVSSNVNGVSIGDERFWDFFSEVERLGLSVFVHALNPTMSDRMPRSAAASYALGAEQMVAVTSVTSGGLAERCPNLRLAFSHGGGGFPALIPRAHYFWARKWNEEAPDETPTGRDGEPLPSPFEQARRFYYDGLVFDRRTLRMVIDTFGPSRVLIGTDFPAMDREHPAGKTLLEMGLPDDVVEKITWSNCFEFLGMEPPAL